MIGTGMIGGIEPRQMMMSSPRSALVMSFARWTLAYFMETRIGARWLIYRQIQHSP